MFGFSTQKLLTKEDVVSALKDVLLKYHDTEADKIKLKEELVKLKDEVAEIKTTKKIEERDIAHIIKCKEEKNAIEYQKKEIELMKTYQKREMELQDVLHTKVMESLEKHKAELQKIYCDIIARLPNVNVEVKR